MNTPQPYFSIGEEVVVQSSFSPEHNGEDIIESMMYGTVTLKDDTTYEGWLYITEQQTDKTLSYIEPSLRKKHKPSDESFHSLMSSLKIKEGVS